MENASGISLQRYMPERLINSKAILQRHELLSCLIFEASSVKMWNELPEEFPENLESTYHQMLAHDSLRVVIKPLIYSLHRWSLEEDVTLLLRAAAVMVRSI